MKNQNQYQVLIFLGQKTAQELEACSQNIFNCCSFSCTAILSQLKSKCVQFRLILKRFSFSSKEVIQRGSSKSSAPLKNMHEVNMIRWSSNGHILSLLSTGSA